MARAWVWLGLWGVLACGEQRAAGPRDAGRDAATAQLDAATTPRDAAEGGASDAAESGTVDAATSGEIDAGVTVAPLRVQVFSRTAGFRHDTIEPGQRALSEIVARLGGTTGVTEDPAQLTAALPETDVVVFLMTTGDVLDGAQQTALEAFVRGGGGFVGVHSATDTEYDWPFYETLVGALFDNHPAIQPANLKLEARDHPIVSFLPAVWQRTDEWYNFRKNPRPNVDVLATIDETSYEGGTMGSDHPMIWCHSVERGRSFYTALGHTQESWREALFLQHLERALLWAAKR